MQILKMACPFGNAVHTGACALTQRGTYHEENERSFGPSRDCICDAGPKMALPFVG
jgi:hypothetical protein